jgi:hypothetical protein
MLASSNTGARTWACAPQASSDVNFGGDMTIEIRYCTA